MEFNNISSKNNHNTLYEQKYSTMTMYDMCSLPLIEGTLIVVINTVLSIVGTFGNILIIMAVIRSPRLRQKPSNFLLLSLAVADLLVTMVAQPLFTASISLKTFSHRCHNRIDSLYLLTAPIASTSSVFHLAAISIDRSLSALLPHKHRDIIKKSLKLMLVICWGLSAICVCLLVLAPKSTTAVYITLLLCLVIMIIAYGLILYKILAVRVVNVPASTARDRAMEKRVSGTVAIIIVLFAVCWVPLISFHLSNATTNGTEATYWWIRTLYLANSSMNFIVYGLRIKQFRSAFLKIIKRGLRKVGKLLPKKCRCQCVESLSARNFSQNTQHTPVSPTSMTVAPVPLNLIRHEERESLVIQMKNDGNKYVIQGTNTAIKQDKNQHNENIVEESKKLINMEKHEQRFSHAAISGENEEEMYINKPENLENFTEANDNGKELEQETKSEEDATSDGINAMVNVVAPEIQDDLGQNREETEGIVMKEEQEMLAKSELVAQTEHHDVEINKD